MSSDRGMRLKDFVGLLNEVLAAHGDMPVWVKSEGEWGKITKRENIFVLSIDTFEKAWVRLMDIDDKKLFLIDLDGDPTI